MRLALAATLNLALAATVGAQTPPQSETMQAGSIAVTLHLHPFLSAEELNALRQIGASEEAMRTFIGGDDDSYGAIAVAPAQGFMRDGVPVASAVAMSQLPDAETARAAAVEACTGAAGSACVVLLEAAPRR